VNRVRLVQRRTQQKKQKHNNNKKEKKNPPSNISFLVIRVTSSTCISQWEASLHMYTAVSLGRHDTKPAFSTQVALCP
jgi:hypothetical protein